MTKEEFQGYARRLKNHLDLMDRMRPSCSTQRQQSLDEVKKHDPVLARHVEDYLNIERNTLAHLKKMLEE